MQSFYDTTFGSPQNLADFVWEVGTDLTPQNILYPAIRFGIDRKRVYDCGGCSNCQFKLTIDIYIQTSTDDSEQSDDLRDIISEIFHNDCGRYVGEFTEGTTFQTIVSANPFMVYTWDFKELVNNQFQDFESVKFNAGGVASGIRSTGYIRYVGYIEEQTPIS